jgi:hypothetical protein
VPGTVANGVVSGRPFLHMDGTQVFKFAVKVLAEVAREALDANKLPASAIDWLIPHQANVRIMDATMKKLGLPPERMVYRRPARQYVGRVDSLGARRRGARWPHPSGTQRHAGRSGRRIHVGFGVAAMGLAMRVER